MEFSLSGSTQTFQTLNEINACQTSVQHWKVSWRAVARRSSQLKPYPLGGRTRCLGGRGPFPPLIFGPTGRVLLALLSLIAYA